MQNIKPISNTEILIARIKGVFPFFGNILILTTSGLTAWYFQISYWWLLLIPFGVALLYYALYALLILSFKLLLRLINKYKKR